MHSLRRAQFAMCPIILLAACGGGNGNGSTEAANNLAAAASESDWFVGYWADNPEVCQGGDSGTAYEKDGTYTEMGESGTWTLSGSILRVTQLTESDEMYEPKKIDNPVTYQIEIVSHDATHAKFRSSDGTTTDMFKCPAA